MQKGLLKQSKESGATYVEMAFSITLFMFIIVTVIELMRFGYTIATLQHVLDQTLRVTSIANFSESQYANSMCAPALLKNHGRRAICAEAFAKEQIEKFLGKKSNINSAINDWDQSEFVFVKRYPKLSSLSSDSGFKPPCLLEQNNEYDRSAGYENEYFSICINYKFDLFMGIKKNIETFGITKNEPFAD